MGFFGIKKKISKFTEFEKDDINNFVKNLSKDLKKFKISFEFDIHSSNPKNFENFTIPRANAYAGNKWIDRVTVDTYINTDHISYKVNKNNKEINDLEFKKYYINNTFSKDVVTFKIQLKKGIFRYEHKYEDRASLGIRFHPNYNLWGQLPARQHVDYSEFNFNEVGISYSLDKNEKTLINKYKKPKTAENYEFEKYKNIIGRCNEDYIEYIEFQRKIISEHLAK